MRVASVVIDISARSLDRPFDYAVTDRTRGVVQLGVPVLVRFGARRAVGYVVALEDRSSDFELKTIEAVLDEPLFGPHVPKVVQWIASHYACGLAEALRPFLPPGGAPSLKRDETGGYSLVRPSVRAADDRWVSRLASGDAALVRQGATKQRALLDAVSAGPVRVAELRAELGEVSGALARLQELGLVEVSERRRWRTPEYSERTAPRPERLTPDQELSVSAIVGAQPGSTVLLDGVTGSGKTEVYMVAIERALGEGGDAIVLVPEISLTPQTVGRFRDRFGEDVAVLHSRLGAGERFDQWDLVRKGKASVVVGPRSALFAPVRDLRLVVIDEEHEASYKQGSTPRYHARDVAARLCEDVGAVLVLGSATPSLESTDAAERGRVRRVLLSTRATGAAMPDVEVVDMSLEFAQGNRSMLSSALRDALASVQARGEKAIVLLNRRGFASFLLCRECGHVPACGECSVSMTYHQTGQRLTCHHCGSVRAVPSRCPECDSPFLRQFGAGTQRVAAELERAFAGLPVVRMDADTTKGRGGHESRLAEFEQLASGVLLGTQMIAKGLDYPQVTLVGVLSADLGLRLPDFRAGERTYQLLEQVAGRAGRADAPGRVVIQTYWPDHPAVLAAARHDPSLFYATERDVRRELGYPPFGSLARVLVTGSVREDVVSTAGAVAVGLRSNPTTSRAVLGPAPAPLERVRGAHRWHVLVKDAPDVALGPVLRDALASAEVPPRGVSVVPDVDPFDML